MTDTLGETLLRQLRDDVEVVTSGRLLFRPVWSKPEMAEGEWMLESAQAGDD